MAVLSRGRYTYGSKTWAEIILITGASIGDTVWDTTYTRRRAWDGNNFVHASQKTVESTTTLSNGAVVVSSSTENNKIGSQVGTADTEGIIGIVEDSKTGLSGALVTLTYHGDVKALIVASGANPANPGDFIKNSTALAGYGDTAAAGPGTFGNYIDSSATTSGLRRVLFRPVERA